MDSKVGKVFGTFLIGLVAFIVAGLVAYISVSGLGKLYAGSILVISLAGALEIGKLIAASFIHNYWTRISLGLKLYLTSAVLILMLITSTGIYGYLSAANQQTVDELSIQDSQIEILELKKNRFNEQLDFLNQEKSDLSTSIQNYSQGLANNKIQYTDSTGRIITTTSSNTRRVLNNQLNDAKAQRDEVSTKIEAVADSVTNLDIQILEIKKNSDVAAEVGPLKFISKVTGLPMEQVTNYLSLLLIFVGDPFAVVMVIVLNTKIRLDSNQEVKKKIETQPRELYGDTETEAKSILKNIMSKFKKKDGVNEGTPTSEEHIEAQDDTTNDVDDLYEKYKSKKEELISDTGANELHTLEKDVHTEEQKKLHEAIKHRGNIMGHPYFEHKKFDWKKYKNVWKNDPRAVAYWMKNKNGGEEDFTTKTY